MADQIDAKQDQGRHLEEKLAACADQGRGFLELTVDLEVVVDLEMIWW